MALRAVLVAALFALGEATNSTNVTTTPAGDTTPDTVSTTPAATTTDAVIKTTDTTTLSATTDTTTTQKPIEENQFSMDVTVGLKMVLPDGVVISVTTSKEYLDFEKNLRTTMVNSLASKDVESVRVEKVEEKKGRRSLADDSTTTGAAGEEEVELNVTYVIRFKADANASVAQAALAEIESGAFKGTFKDNAVGFTVTEVTGVTVVEIKKGGVKTTASALEDEANLYTTPPASGAVQRFAGCVMAFSMFTVLAW